MPAIRTPILLFVASLDAMIPPSSSLELAERCRKVNVQYFFGSHHVPKGVHTTRAAIQFVAGLLNGSVTSEDEDGSDAELLWEDVL